MALKVEIWTEFDPRIGEWVVVADGWKELPEKAKTAIVATLNYRK